MTEFKLSDTIGISKSQAKEIIQQFFARVPKVDNFLYSVGQLGRERGYIKTAKPFGRIRWFKDHEEAVERNNNYRLSEIERASKNTPIQGTNADLIKVALIDVQNEIEDNEQFKDVQIILSVYDEINTLCPEEVAEEWKIRLEEIMVQAGELIIRTIPVVVDVKINNYWTK